MSVAIARDVEISRAAAPTPETRIWSPLPLIAMVGFMLALVGAWGWYQRLEGFASGIDATDPAFAEKWMPLWYLNCALAAISQIAIPIYFWVTRDRDITRLSPAVELKRYLLFFSIMLTAAIGGLIALVFGAVDAAWHQVVVRDTSLTPSHIVLFFGIVPLNTAFSMSAFFFAHTRLPQFADKISVALLLSFTGPFLALPSVAYNEWGHAYWLMEELFIAPLHWGFVILGWVALTVIAVIVQSLPRAIELLRIVSAPPVESTVAAGS